MVYLRETLELLKEKNMVDVKRVDVSNSQKDNFFQTSIIKLKINYEKRSYIRC